MIQQLVKSCGEFMVVVGGTLSGDQGFINLWASVRGADWLCEGFGSFGHVSRPHPIVTLTFHLIQEGLDLWNGFLQTAVKPWSTAPGVTGEVLSALTSTMTTRFSKTFLRPAKEGTHHHIDLCFIPLRVCWLTTGRSGHF